MNQNNLDKLFQEQLKNLEATPNKRVWNNIESKLKKKKRKLLPFWWFSGGVAALLLLGLLFYPLSKEENNFIKIDSKTIITENTKSDIETKTIEKTKVDSIILPKQRKEQVLVADKKRNLKQLNKKKNNHKNIDNKKELVSTKSAMKKNFLADSSIKKTIVPLKKEKVAFYKKATVFPDKINDLKQEEVTKTEKKINTKKVDLNKLIKKKDSIIISKPLINKWSIAPVFAVLNSNSFTNTSPIDNNLSNSTKGKNSFSYGFKIGYKINKKWSIQSGIHLQEISYVNNQVTIVSTISRNSSSVAFNTGDSFSFQGNPSKSLDIASSSLLNTASLNGNLNQEYGYIEIPVEVKYNLLNTSKFNTQIVAGFSSLFLNKNEVILNSQFLSKSGKATNLNNVNFSGNLGFDFNYSLNTKWSINLNPMFKTQLNTFSKNSNGFSPFNIGVYTGVKYSF